ncbi:MAG: hypothetical protein IH984_04950 [Planctomycetes bacterium]|nr:hypothetical protein [Planctomycetota bacterium]
MNQELTSQIVATAGLVLREFGNQIGYGKNNPKGCASLNFLARSIRQLQAIDLLVQKSLISDSWSLYRSLVERYFLFVNLADTNKFSVFDDWCFKKQYEIENRIKSSSDLKNKPEVKKRRFSPKDKQRYERISQDRLVKQWRRPNAEEVARHLDLKFLYDAGYAHASSFVHPISTDGLDDYLHLMNRESEIKDEDADVLLSNSQLVTVLHIQHFLNQPEYKWHVTLYDLLDALLDRNQDHSYKCSDLLRKVKIIHKTGTGLCQAKPTSS